MSLPAQPNFFTLACRDVERMAELLRAFGWPESPESEPAHRVFSFRDPEGNVWDVAWKHGSSIAANGSLTWAA